MPGKLAANFRQGNLSERLADYLLSSIGIATAVSREDDIGFDFYCQLSDQESGPFLTFSHPYIAQVKSESVDSIVYGNPSPDKWKPEDISWLRKLEWPLFITTIDKMSTQIKIYRTTNIWFPLYENPNCTQIEMSFKDVTAGELLKRPEVISLPHWPPDKGDGKKYVVPLGNPIIFFSNSDISDTEIMRTRKSIFRDYINLEMANRIYRRQNVRHFQWIDENRPNEPFTKRASMYYGDATVNISPDIYDSLIPYSISLLLQLAHHQKDSKELVALKEFMKHLPHQEELRQFKGQNPTIFDFVDG